MQKANCSDQPVSFGLLFNDVDSVQWDFGDPASGSLNYSRSINPEHQFPAAGRYTVKAVIYKRCIADTAIREVEIIPDKAVHVPAVIKDSVACTGDELVLDATAADTKVYLWENGLSNPQRVIKEAGHYTLSVYNDCSFDHKEFDVRYENCPCAVYVPNAFTPDGDGLNDVFRPSTQCFARNYAFRVYNRYGAIVFQSNELSKGWNGKINDRESATGVYIWALQYQNPNTKELINKKGTVVLIR